MRKVRFGDVCTFENGDRGANYPTKSDFVETGIPFINAGNIENNTLSQTNFDYITREKYSTLRSGKASRGDIVFCLRGTIGKVAIVEEELVAIASSLVIVRPTSLIDSSFLYYTMTSPYFQQSVLNCNNGSVQGNLSVETLARIEIPYFEMQEQIVISQVLAGIDKKLSNCQKQIDDLSEIASLVYNYWFTQFDFLNDEGRPYRSRGGRMVWNEELKQEIPEGWDVGLISDLGEIVSGATPSTNNQAYYTDHGVAWITPNDLSKCGGRLFVAHGERDITEAGLNSCSAIKMPAGSVIMSSRAPIGYLALACEDCCTNQGCKSIIPNKGYGSYFVFLLLNRLMPVIKSQGAGTTFAEISKESLANVKICLPPKDLAERFEDLVCSLFDQILNLEKQSNELEAFRDWLLPMLMSGQAVVG